MINDVLNMGQNQNEAVSERFSKFIDIDRIKNIVDRSGDAACYQAFCAQLKSLNLQTVSCRICQRINTQRNVVATVFGFDYVQCAVCSHVYVDKLPSWEKYFEVENQVATRMSKNLYENKKINQYRIENVSMPKVKHVLERISDKTPGLWVDVGCGTGEVLICAKKLGWEVLGVDANDSSREFAKKEYGINIKHPDEVSEGILKQAKIISAFNVIEHVTDPYDFMKFYADHTPGNANFVIEVPQFQSLSSVAQASFPAHINRHLIPCSHFQLYTLKSLEFLLNKLGLSVYSQWWFGQDFYEMLQLLGQADKSFGTSSLYKLLLEYINDFQSVLDKNRLSDALLTISKKKNDE